VRRNFPSKKQTGYQDLKYSFSVLGPITELWLTQRQACRLGGDEKEGSVHIILYVTVRHWHAKDTEPWAVCSGSPQI
jgi:hypothetical protein